MEQTHGLERLQSGAQPTFRVGSVAVYGDLVLAPLAGYSDHPYRSICRDLGSAMSYTEFVSVQGVLRGNERTFRILSYGEEERPLVFQVFGRDAKPITEACLRLQELGPDIIDINLGCPSPRISGRGGGSGLLLQPGKIGHIFASLSQHMSIPVSAKIRLGWDRQSLNHLDVAQALEENGAALVAVHARARSDSYGVPADWDAIAEVKQRVRIPVLGNGDVRCVADIDRIKAHTGCDGVMIGRGAIGHPWIFARRDREQIGPGERLAMVERHLDEMARFYGPQRGVILFRKHLTQYIHGLPYASQLRADLMQCTTVEQVLDRLEGVLHTGSNVL
ncbi:MAG: tRNA-dihydrouridine synthase [Anaerolineae bacterium]|nr:tRNA-dihydrouridine synthase [Anaerolineae bacterium]